MHPFFDRPGFKAIGVMDRTAKPATERLLVDGVREFLWSKRPKKFTHYHELADASVSRLPEVQAAHDAAAAAAAAAVEAAAAAAKAEAKAKREEMATDKEAAAAAEDEQDGKERVIKEITKGKPGPPG
ncbi:unnamed protein product [Vitrella brassicaformis CCMP3155]|uniref:Uncharacterized protein n=1 Tax=Vitrella brassicaformis (strain CCMP3155) TaxID=1169540 RepID=A0A0G4ES20_VITBC|nr:unnamed protein product [Vitrella brassicaformis CCMP3155]|eukprot:CEM00702.1 unnamed protein product [Vitrella brassicaformis CCMP3155]